MQKDLTPVFLRHAVRQSAEWAGIVLIIYVFSVSMW